MPAAKQVFINCPFDEEYLPMMKAIVFAVKICGFVPRCALESEDAGEVRVAKIRRIMGACRLGIHDISRTQCTGTPRLPRFNMPFELGLFLGHGGRSKIALILDVERYRYQKYISDIAGQDIRAHGGRPENAIRAVRDWLNSMPGTARSLPGGEALIARYRQFDRHLPGLLAMIPLRASEISFVDWTRLIDGWLESAAAPV